MRIRVFGILFLVLSVGIVSSFAQADCPLLVEKALQAVDTNCSNLQRNSACYGFTQVRAAFTEDVADDFFTQPADRADISTMQSIKTTSLQVGTEEWGVAILSLQANLPDALPGQAVTFVLLGDSEVENAVAPEDVYIAPAPITIRTKTGANIRSGAGLNFNVIGAAQTGNEFLADARSEDAQWMRIVYQETTVAWISRLVVEDNAAIDALPVLNDESRTAMQAFYLRTGVGRTECAEAPQDALMVQGPKNFKVNLTVNGADVKISSTVLFQIVGDNQNQMAITVLDGQAEITPNTLDAQTMIIPAGFTSNMCLSDPDNRGADGENNDRIVTCNASEPTRIDTTLRNNTFCTLQDFPTSVLNYAVDLVCPNDPVPTAVPIRPTTPPQTQPRPTVAPTSVSGEVDCSNFIALSPIFDVAYKGQYFEWTSVAGADEYALNIYNENGAFLTGAFTGKATGIVINVGELRPGNTISWDALALKGGQTVCTTPRTSNLYVQPETNVEQPRAFSGSYSCTNINDLVIQWNSAGPNDAVYFYYDVNSSEPYSIGAGESGQYRSTFQYCDNRQGRLGTSSGQFFDLPPINCGSCPIG